MPTNPETLRPAVEENGTGLPKELSDEEFKKTLFAWFEERGMIADLRSHLRQKMIECLQGTALGQSVNRNQNLLSPKTQMMNLLIAELLFKRKYHYSLSVFSSEVPIGMLPETTNSLMNYSSNSTVQSLSKHLNFSHQNFWDILQTLGFKQDSPECKKLFDIYFDNSENSLLQCMVHVLTTLCADAKVSVENIELNNNSESLNLKENWTKDVNNLLLHYNVTPSKRHYLLKTLMKIVEGEQAKVRLEENTKFNNKQLELKHSLKTTEQDIYKTLGNIEKTFFREKEKLHEEMFAYEKEIDKLRLQIVEKQSAIDANNDKLQKREEYFNRREVELEEQSEMLQARMKKMQTLYDNVIQENMRIISYKTGQPKTEAEQKYEQQYNVLKKELDSMRNEMEEAKNTIKTISSSQTTAPPQQCTKESEQKLLHGIIDKLERQNAELRFLNQEQQKRIDELTLRNSALMIDLQNSQSTVSLLSQSRPTVPIRQPAPPPMPDRPRRNNTLSGAGETLSFMHTPIPRASHRYVFDQLPRDQPRRIPKRLLIHKSTSEETSTSPTEEVLNIARRRLRKLEAETEAVDRNYREFKERHSRAIKENLQYFNPPTQTEALFTIVQPSRQGISTNKRPKSSDHTTPAKHKPAVDESTGAKSKQTVNKSPTNNKENVTLEETRSSAVHSTNSSGLFEGLLQVRSLSISSIDISSESDEEKVDKIK